MNIFGLLARRSLLAVLVVLEVQRLDAAEPVGLFAAWGASNLVTTNSIATVGPITRIAAGGFHALALRADGTVFAWGNNASGQTNLPAGVSNIIAISAGAQHNLCLRSNGTVVAWGLNSSGQTNVPPALNGVVAVAAGADHSVALRTNGAVVALGISPALTNVPASAKNITAIAAGVTVTLALRSDGTVVAWGKSDNSLTNLPAGLTNVAAISAGLNHCLALRSNGTVLAWGDNTYAQTVVPSQLTNAVAISAGWSHSLARQADGTFVAWGLSASGQTTLPAAVTNLNSFAAGNMLNLGVDLTPHFLSRPPANLTLALGQTFTLNATVLSGSRFNLQWHVNGDSLPGETNEDLAITDFNSAKAGVYSVVVSNLYKAASATTIVRLSNAPLVLVNGVLAGGGPVICTNSAIITLIPASDAYTSLYYSMDGTEPDFTSFPYTGSFVTASSATLRAVAFNPQFTGQAEAAPVALQVIPAYPLLTVSFGGGIGISGAPDLGANSYLSNTLVTLTAIPNNGWTFLHWSGDSMATSAVINVVMDQPRALQAVFGTTLNLFTNGSGQIVTDPPNGPFPYGSSVTLTALPQAGHYFFGWAGVLGGAANPVTLTVNNASGITALFAALKADQVSLVVLPVGGGSVLASPAKTVYTNGEIVSLAASATSNRVFSYWSGDASGTSNPLSLTLYASELVYANFIPGTPTNFLPVFSLLPGGRSLGAGQSMVLSTLVSGMGALNYQWRFNGTPLTGATSSNLALSAFTAAQAGLYDVVVGSVYGAVTSPPAPVALFGLKFAPSKDGPLPLLTVDCAPGTQFHLEYSDNLSSTNWDLLAPLTLPSAQQNFIDVPPANVPARFYRLLPQ